MVVLGIDPSLTGLGWCVHDGRALGKERVVAKGRVGTPSTKNFVWRNRFLRDYIHQLLVDHPVEAVGSESPPFGESFSEGLYGLFVYVNEAIYLHRKDVVYFDPGRVKLLAKMDPGVRKGKMDKVDMVEAAKAETGIKRWSHDEADAYIVARSTARFWDLFHGRIMEDDLTPSERQTFLAIHTFERGKNKGKTVRKGILYKEGDRFYRWSLLTEV